MIEYVPSRLNEISRRCHRVNMPIDVVLHHFLPAASKIIRSGHPEALTDLQNSNLQLFSCYEYRDCVLTRYGDGALLSLLVSHRPCSVCVALCIVI